jgi:hypothetical protein
MPSPNVAKRRPFTSSELAPTRNLKLLLELSPRASSTAPRSFSAPSSGPRGGPKASSNKRLCTNHTPKMEKKYTTQKRPKTPQTKSDGDGA